MIKSALIILLLFSTTCAIAQSSKLIDSLLTQVEKSHDSLKSGQYNNLSWKLRNSQPVKALEYGKLGAKYAEEYKQYENLIKAYSFIGVAYRNLGNYTEALDFYYKGLNLSEKYKFPEQEGYGHINLGNLYLYQDNVEKAIEHLNSALKIALEINDIRIQSYAYLNLGRVYLLKSDFVKSKYNFIKAREIRETFASKDDIAVTIKYLADVYNKEGKLDSALFFYDKAKKFTNFNSDRDLLADIFNKTAELYIKQGKYNLALLDCDSSLKVARQVGTKLRTRDAFKTLSIIYDSLGLYNEATAYKDSVIVYNDSLFNQQLTEKITNIQYSIEQERKQVEIDLLNKDKRIQQLYIIGLISILIFTGILIYYQIYTNKTLRAQKMEIAFKNVELNNKNEEIKAQNEEIEQQKNYVTRQRDEVLQTQIQLKDSIQYAQRIQNALFPGEPTLTSNFTDAFVFIQPRDIVSGDFYWFYKHDDIKFLVVADCTGHGVPGAFMSLLGISALNEVIIRREIHKPNQILEELRRMVIKLLGQNTENKRPKDGMDLMLIVINELNNTLEYSGANMPAMFIRDNILQALKPTRNPIGVFVNEKPFESELIEIKKGDKFYLYSDGFSSQFGGLNYEKYKLYRLKELILSSHTLPMHQQQVVIKSNLENWQGKYKQIDDILLIGITI